MSYITMRVKVAYYTIMVRFYYWLWCLSEEALAEFNQELTKLHE